MAENELTVVIREQRVYAGKRLSDETVGRLYLIDGVEFHVIVNVTPTGPQIIPCPIILGNIEFSDPVVVIRASKDSVYYKQYYAVMGNIHLP